jgi:hypothetical protein
MTPDPPDRFRLLEDALEKDGAGALFDRLAELFRAEKKYPHLFEALLMKKRHEMGLPIQGTDSIRDLPEHLQSEIEEYYVGACKTVGSLHLEAGDIVGAWPYFRAIDEPARVAEAIETWEPPARTQGAAYDEAAGSLTDAIVDIALHQGVHPARGYSLVLSEHGVCRAITVFEHQFPFGGEVKEACGKMLVDRLHRDLVANLKSDIAQREGAEPPDTDIRKLIADRAWLFEGYGYHVDVSHLQAVIRAAAILSDRSSLEKGLELCEYGRRLPRDFQHPDRPPFTDFYADYRIFIQALLGTGVDGAIRYFTQKVPRGGDEDSVRFPAEVLVYLLYRTGKYREAIEAHIQHLPNARPGSSVAPSLLELCDRAGDHAKLLEKAREKDDLLQYAAGLVHRAGPRTAD